jgi:hypothetical protein
MYRYRPTYKGIPPKRDANIAVMLDPFSPKSMSARIPDGKAYDSSGIRLQSVVEQTVDSGELYICIFPGINNGVWICNPTDPQANFLSGLGAMPFSQHFSVEQDGTSHLKQIENTAISRWRLVSQGLKISLINNSDENDGYWEAIRYQVGAHQMNEFGWLAYPLAANKGSNFWVGPNLAHVPVSGESNDNLKTPGLVFVNQALTEHPTYVSGKLKDIHRHAFVLHPTNGEHDFVTTDMRWNAAADAEQQSASSAKQGIDTSFDCIFIRIKGRPADSSNKTRLLLHSVANQEVVYDEGSVLSRHHTKAPTPNPTGMAGMRRAQQTNRLAAKKQRAVIKFQGY